MEDVMVNNAMYHIVPIVDLFTWWRGIFEFYLKETGGVGVISECDM